MSANTIDGKAFAARLRAQVETETAQLKKEHGVTPGLATVLVGNDPASEVYIRNKNKTAEAIGFILSITIFPKTRARTRFSLS